MASENRSTVLIVDDRDEVRAKLRAVLEVTYRVLEASNSIEGLAFAREVLPDLIIGDEKLEGISGFDLCMVLKEDASTAHIPFILLTGEETPEVCRSCVLSGADACLEQPIKAATIWLQVGNVLARKYRVQTIPGKETEVDSEQSADSYFVRQARHVIEQHMADPLFSVEQFAKELAICQSQLLRKLRRELDVTPSQLIRNIRLKKAKRLLKQRDANITQIAFDVGFNSVSYFSRSFRRHFGESPSYYRNNQ